MLKTKRSQRSITRKTPIQSTFPNEGVSKMQDVEETIYNKEGKEVRKILTQRSVYQDVNEDAHFHRGETCDNYSIEALQRAGVELKRVSTPYERLSLQEKSDYSDYLDLAIADLDKVVPTPKPAPISDVKPITFNENE